MGPTSGINASTGTFADAAKFGDVIVLALLWAGAENALKLAGAENFAGKVVIDAINPLVFEPGNGPALAIGHTDSAGEQVQRWLPSAHVVKAFNIVGNEHMFKPDFPGGPPDMFICGNDAAAKQTVTGILKDFGGRRSISEASKAPDCWSRCAFYGSATRCGRGPGITRSSCCGSRRP